MWCSIWDMQNRLGEPFGAASITAWGNGTARHALHRRHVRNLSILTAATVALAVFFHPAAALLVVFTPLLAIEIWLLRRSRTMAPPTGSGSPRRSATTPTP